MGVLSASGTISEDGSMPAAEVVPEDPPAATPPAADEAPSDYQAPEKRRQGSRRAAAEAAVDDKIKSHLGEFEKKWTTERQTYEQQLQEQRQQNARLAGQLEAMQRMPAPAPVPVAEGPDPAELRRQAKKALDDKDFDSYERLRDQAAEIAADRKVEERVSRVARELRAEIPQQAPPEIQFLMTQHRNVALNGQRGVQAVMLKDQELGLYGTPPGPERVAKAFELADRMLAPRQQPGRPQFSQDGAAALAAVPTGRPSGGAGAGGEAGEPLSSLEKETAKAAGMTEADYKKWKSPDKFIRR
jgi:hypothetical protein